MPDIAKSNLEPIEEGDLNLEKKLGVVSAEKKPEENNEAQKVEKEAPKEVSSAEKDSSYNKILTKIKTTSQPADEKTVKDDAIQVYGNVDAESQIQQLVDIALNKGVVHAVKVAKHLEDNYVLDMFHDKLLADELHTALMKKGLIEEL